MKNKIKMTKATQLFGNLEKQVFSYTEERGFRCKKIASPKLGKDVALFDIYTKGGWATLFAKHLLIKVAIPFDLKGNEEEGIVNVNKIPIVLVRDNNINPYLGLIKKKLWMVYNGSIFYGGTKGTAKIINSNDYK